MAGLTPTESAGLLAVVLLSFAVMAPAAILMRLGDRSGARVTALVAGGIWVAFIGVGLAVIAFLAAGVPAQSADGTWSWWTILASAAIAGALVSIPLASVTAVAVHRATGSHAPPSPSP